MQRSLSSESPAPRRYGFTLVELLVVIGIIAVLISILLPSLNKARCAAQSVACLSNLRQLSIATLNYANSNNGFFPTASNGNYTVDSWINWNIDSTGAYKNSNYYKNVLSGPHRSPTALGYGDLITDSALTPYLGGYGGLNPNVFKCPAMDYSDPTAFRFGIIGLSNTSNSPYLFGYEMNTMLCIPNNWVGYAPTIPYAQKSTKGYNANARGHISQIRNAGQKILLVCVDPLSTSDSGWNPYWYGPTTGSLYNIRSGTTYFPAIQYNNFPTPAMNTPGQTYPAPPITVTQFNQSGTIAQTPNTIHSLGYYSLNDLNTGNGSGNVGFCDGHGETLTRVQVGSPAYFDPYWNTN